MTTDKLAERMAMPTVGEGTFTLCGKTYTLPIVKTGKRDITLRANDGGLITLNKKYVQVAA